MTLAVGHGTVLWYTTRGAGIVALLLLTAGLILGIVGSIRWRSERWPRFAVVDVHRNLTLFAIVFVALHVLTTILDGYAPIGLKDAVIPFVSRYRPLWLGFGALAFDLALALVATSLLRGRIGYRAWRLVHWLAYAAWPVAVIHGLGSGSDARFGWFALLAFGCAASVAVAVAYRVVRSPLGAPVRMAAGIATVAVAITAVVWYHGGPAKRGWAARAGTPTSILRRHQTSPAASTAAAQVTMPGSFDDQLVGRTARSEDPTGDVGLAFGAAAHGRVPGVLRFTLWGVATGDGGVSLSDSRVTFSPVGLAGYSGKVAGLQGNQVQADLTSSLGAHLRLTFVLQLNNVAATFTGSLHGDSGSQGGGE